MARTEADRSLDDAAARSPELARMLAGKHDNPSARYRRVALLVCGGFVAVGILWFAASAIGRPGQKAAEQRGEPAEEIDRSHYLGPIQTAAAGAGEEVAPFSGFAISVETVPPGALVSIAGVPRGEAPALANLDCRPGRRVELRAELAGHRPVRREIACREDALVKVTLRLER